MIRLLLLDIYIRSILLNGAPIWGPSLVAMDRGLGRDHPSSMGVSYLGPLHATLGLHHRARNEVVYILSGRLSLSLCIGKALIHFTALLQGSDWLVARVMEWAGTLPDGSEYHLLSA